MTPVICICVSGKYPAASESWVDAHLAGAVIVCECGIERRPIGLSRTLALSKSRRHAHIGGRATVAEARVKAKAPTNGDNSTRHTSNTIVWILLR